MNIKPGLFTSEYMINLDEGMIIIGSAGDSGTEYTVSISRELVEGSLGLKIKVDGLHGGHSGVDTHLPRANANKLLGDFLYTLSEETHLRISSIEGGTRGNAIPRSATCTFAISKKNACMTKAVFDNWSEKARREFPVEEDLAFTLIKVPAEKVISEEQTASIIGILYEVQQGPFSWSKSMQGLVETSNNLGIVKTGECCKDLYVPGVQKPRTWQRI